MQYEICFIPHREPVRVLVASDMSAPHEYLLLQFPTSNVVPTVPVRARLGARYRFPDDIPQILADLREDNPILSLSSFWVLAVFAFCGTRGWPLPGSVIDLHAHHAMLYRMTTAVNAANARAKALLAAYPPRPVSPFDHDELKPIN